MQIKCEKCSAVSDAAMPETYLEGEVELTFLRCPSCGEVYPVWSTATKRKMMTILPIPSSGASMRCSARTTRCGEGKPALHCSQKNTIKTCKVRLYGIY